MSMKKSLVIIATVAILGILAVYAIPLSSKSTSPTSVSASVITTSTTETSQQAPPSTAIQLPTSTQSSNNALKDGTYTGISASNQFGDVQLKLTISGGKITDISALDFPASDHRSLQISQFSIPELTQEALTAQSANIDSVSGASYTSQSYVESLQSAINKAKA